MNPPVVSLTDGGVTQGCISVRRALLTALFIYIIILDVVQMFSSVAGAGVEWITRQDKPNSLFTSGGGGRTADLINAITVAPPMF